MASLISLYQNGSPFDTSNPKRVIRDTAVEFMATTVFIYFGTLSAGSTGAVILDGVNETNVAKLLPIALAFGITIMVLVYSIGHITGGHMNPGVSLLMFLRREMSFKKMLCYWLAQFSGAMLGSAIVLGSTTKYFNEREFNLGATTLDSNTTTLNGFLLELMGSFFFYFVIAQTALDKKGIATSSFPPLAIGWSLVVTHICLIPFTGCGVNPARTFGPSMINCMSGRCSSSVVGPAYWVYYIAPFLASFLVAEVTCWLQWTEEDDTIEKEEKNSDDKLLVEA